MQTKFLPLDQFKVYHPSFALRQKMLNLIQNLSYYMSVEVVEPAWHTLAEDIASCSTVDEVLAKHGDFLNSCLHDCLLSSPQLLATVKKLLSVCSDFALYMQNLGDLNYLLNPRLEVLDLQLKHNHALLGLGDMLHPVVVGSALNMDELAPMAFSGGDLHSHKWGVVVASSHLALALVGEVFNGEALVWREVCEPVLQGLLVGGIATPAVNVDIVSSVCALSLDVLLNFKQARTLRLVALRLLSGAIVGLWRPAPDCVQLDEDAGLNLVALLLGNEAIVVALVALAQLGKVEGW